jgi:hypothetical protein
MSNKKKLESCLVNERIIKYIRSDDQFFRFVVEDGVALNIGGDKNVRTNSIITSGKFDNLDMVIEKVDYARIGKESIITFNDNLKLSFETKSGSYIFISFGNTIECKILT